MQLNGYSDLTRLSKGGMATVYKGRQESLNRTVAIKFLSAEFLWDDQVKKFFDQESLVIARLNHPNIIHIIDRGVTPNGRPYFVMDYIDGYDLSEVTKQKQLSINSRLQLLLQTCKGMAFAHKNGVVHRDIKPANILIDDQGHVYILDFGIAWLEASGKPEGEEIVGTPDYMSPEQFSDPQSVSQLSDIYSLGAVMYELFSGALPAEHYNNLAANLQTLQQPLAELIVECLQTEPGKRPASADELGFRLIKALKGAHINQEDKAEARATIGQKADKFELLDVISRNRFGAAYLFEDKIRQHLLVVKKRINTDDGFEQAKKLQTLRHNHIIRVLGTSRNNKAFIVVMEFLTGGNLQDRLSRPYTLARFFGLAKDLCAAIQFAHEKKIAHGDLRPSNILFDQHETLKISDFGFKKHYGENEMADWYQPKNKKAPVIQRDIYSAGAIFYHMLTGSAVKMKYGLLKVDKKFEALDSRMQSILKNMLEMQSINVYTNFSAVLTDLNHLQKELNTKQPGQAKGFRYRHFIYLLVSINIMLFFAFYFLNEEFYFWINEILQITK